MINFINLTPGSACLAPANAAVPILYYLNFPDGAVYACGWSGFIPTNFKNKQHVILTLYLQGEPAITGVTEFDLILSTYDADGILVSTHPGATGSVDLANPALNYKMTFELAPYFVANSDWFIVGLDRDTTTHPLDVFAGDVRFLDATIIPSSV